MTASEIPDPQNKNSNTKKSRLKFQDEKPTNTTEHLASYDSRTLRRKIRRSLNPKASSISIASNKTLAVDIQRCSVNAAALAAGSFPLIANRSPETFSTGGGTSSSKLSFQPIIREESNIDDVSKQTTTRHVLSNQLYNSPTTRPQETDSTTNSKNDYTEAPNPSLSFRSMALQAVQKRRNTNHIYNCWKCSWSIIKNLFLISYILLHLGVAVFESMITRNSLSHSMYSVVIALGVYIATVIPIWVSMALIFLRDRFKRQCPATRACIHNLLCRRGSYIHRHQTARQQRRDKDKLEVLSMTHFINSKTEAMEEGDAKTAATTIDKFNYPYEQQQQQQQQHHHHVDFHTPVQKTRPYGYTIDSLDSNSMSYRYEDHNKSPLRIITSPDITSKLNTFNYNMNQLPTTGFNNNRVEIRTLTSEATILQPTFEPMAANRKLDGDAGLLYYYWTAQKQRMKRGQLQADIAKMTTTDTRRPSSAIANVGFSIPSAKTTGTIISPPVINNYGPTRRRRYDSINLRYDNMITAIDEEGNNGDDYNIYRNNNNLLLDSTLPAKRISLQTIDDSHNICHSQESCPNLVNINRVFSYNQLDQRNSRPHLYSFENRPHRYAVPIQLIHRKDHGTTITPSIMHHSNISSRRGSPVINTNNPSSLNKQQPSSVLVEPTHHSCFTSCCQKILKHLIPTCSCKTIDTDYIAFPFGFALCIYESSAFQVSMVLRNLGWCGLYIWLTTLVYRDDPNEFWDTSNIPYTFFILEAVFMWMITWDYLIGLLAASDPFRYIISFQSIVDLLTMPIAKMVAAFIVPQYSQQYSVYTGSLRILRLARIEGALARVIPWISTVKLRIISLTMGACVITLMFSSAMFALEAPSESRGFTTLYDFIFFAVVTISTVGYGDFAPTKPASKAIVMVAIIGALAFLPAQINKLITALQTPAPSLGKIPHEYEDYIAIGGPIEPRQLIIICRELANSIQGCCSSILVITPGHADMYREVIKTAFTHARINIAAVQETSTTSSKIGMYYKHARAVFIVGTYRPHCNDLLHQLSFRDPEADQLDDDQNTLMRFLKVQQVCWPDRPICVQLNDGTTKHLVTEMGAYHVVCLQHIKMKLLAKSCAGCPGFVTLISNLFYQPLQDVELFLKNDHLDEKSDVVRNAKLYFRGTRYQIYRLEFPQCFYGLQYSLLARVLVSYYEVYLIGVSCVTKEYWLNPVGYRIGDELEYFTDWPFAGIVLAPSLAVVQTISELTRISIPEEQILFEELYIQRKNRSRASCISAYNSFLSKPPTNCKDGLDSNLEQHKKLAFQSEENTYSCNDRHHCYCNNQNDKNNCCQTNQNGVQRTTAGIKEVDDIYAAKRHVFQEPDNDLIVTCGWPRGMQVFCAAALGSTNCNVIILAPRHPSGLSADALLPFAHMCAWVRGSALDVADLVRAGVLHAKSCCVFSCLHVPWCQDISKQRTDTQAILVREFIYALHHADTMIERRLQHFMETHTETPDECTRVGRRGITGRSMTEDFVYHSVNPPSSMNNSFTAPVVVETSSKTVTPETSNERTTIRINSSDCLSKASMSSFIGEQEEHQQQCKEKTPEIKTTTVRISETPLAMNNNNNNHQYHNFKNTITHNQHRSKNTSRNPSLSSASDSHQVQPLVALELRSSNCVEFLDVTPLQTSNKLFGKSDAENTWTEHGLFLSNPEFTSGRVLLEEMLYGIICFSLPISRFCTDSRIIDHLVGGMHVPLPEGFPCSCPIWMEPVPVSYQGRPFSVLMDQFLKDSLKLAIAVYRQTKKLLPKKTPLDLLQGDDAYQCVVISCPPLHMPLQIGDQVYVIHACPEEALGLLFSDGST